jgi:hypothetical protein
MRDRLNKKSVFSPDIERRPLSVSVFLTQAGRSHALDWEKFPKEIH